MNTVQKIRTDSLGIIRTVFQGHHRICGSGHIDLYIFIFFQFCLHGICCNQCHLFLTDSVILCTEISAACSAVPGINADDNGICRLRLYRIVLTGKTCRH